MKKAGGEGRRGIEGEEVKEGKKEGGREGEKEGGREGDWKSRKQATMLPVTATCPKHCFLVRDAMLLKTCYMFFIVSPISTCFLSYPLLFLNMLANISSPQY